MPIYFLYLEYVTQIGPELAKAIMASGLSPQSRPNVRLQTLSTITKPSLVFLGVTM